MVRVTFDAHSFAGTTVGLRTPKSGKARMRSFIEVRSSARRCTFVPFVRRWAGREAATGRKVAIKKIKVGLFKDGLDMSAIREVKYLRELKHQNVIEVGAFVPPMTAGFAHKARVL
jgi:serine/threonine protein kinase